MQHLVYKKMLLFFEVAEIVSLLHKFVNPTERFGALLHVYGLFHFMEISRVLATDDQFIQVALS